MDRQRSVVAARDVHGSGKRGDVLRRRTRRERMEGASGARIVNGDVPVDAGGDPHGSPVMREPDVVREVDGHDAATRGADAAHW